MGMINYFAYSSDAVADVNILGCGKAGVVTADFEIGRPSNRKIHSQGLIIFKKAVDQEKSGIEMA